MATTTTNFGWDIPQSTDLVKDGATAIAALGQDIDTALVDLKGGTTGQVLAKASNTDLDYTWVAQDDSNAIQNAIVDAKGDLIAASAADTPARLAVGNNGETLVADSSTSTGLRYQGNYAAGKNKFINADMAIAQRGASPVTVSAGARFFSPDRTFGQLNGAGAYTVEQVVDAPAAANASQYSLKAVVTTADTSIAANDQYWLGQIIEAQNFASFQFGTASAQTVTISFWVKSSITGTFGIDIRNSAADRSYVSTYTISAANTWEKKTVTIAGDTSGTWLKDTGVGARIEWSLSAGTDYQTASANSWTASNDMTTAAQTNWMATLSNTFQITAIQIEAGSVATAFQTATGTIQGELAACQRYYYINSAVDNAYATFGVGQAKSATTVDFPLTFPVQLRVAPSAITVTGSIGASTANGGAINNGTITIGNSGKNIINLSMSSTSGLVAGNAVHILANNSSSASISFSAEL